MRTLIKLTLWSLLWIAVWPFVRWFKGDRENCMTWAIQQFDKHGGYLSIRWCKTSKYEWLKWPHFLWSPPECGEHMEHAIPCPEEDTTATKVVPALWFTPKPTKGDCDKVANEN